MRYYLITLALITLGSCSVIPPDLFRDNPQDNVIENERYDPVDGTPLKQGKIIDGRPIKVLQTLEVVDANGNKKKKLVKREIKITGSHYTPPPLPQKPTDGPTWVQIK